MVDALRESGHRNVGGAQVSSPPEMKMLLPKVTAPAKARRVIKHAARGAPFWSGKVTGLKKTLRLTRRVVADAGRDLCARRRHFDPHAPEAAVPRLVEWPVIEGVLLAQLLGDPAVEVAEG